MKRILNIWLPITVLTWLSSYRSSAKMLFWLLLFSTLTGVSIISGLNVGIQPTYPFVYITFYLLILSVLVKKGKLNKFPIAIVTLFFFAFYSALVTITSGNVNFGQIFYVFSIPCITLFSYYLSKRLSIKIVNNYIFKVSLIIFGYGIVDVVLNYFNIPSLDRFLVNSNSVVNNTWATALGVPRATSVFHEPSYLGVFSAVVFLFCLSMITTKSKESVPYLKLVTILSLTNLLLAASLSGFGVVLLGIGFLVVTTVLSGSFRSNLKLILNAVIVLVLSTLLYFVIKLINPYYVNSLQMWIMMRFEFSDASTLNRTGTLLNGYEIGLANPFGLGLGNFTSADLFSTVAGSVGIIGMLILVTWFIVPVFNCLLFSITHKSTSSNLPFYMIIFGLGVAFSTGLGHFIILWPWVLIGIAIRFTHNKQNSSLL